MLLRFEYENIIMSALYLNSGILLILGRHTHLMATFPGQPGQASTSKVKTFWILMKQEMMGWQWHQLDHMQIICN